MFRRNSYATSGQMSVDGLFDPAISDSDNLLFDLDDYKSEPFQHHYSSFETLNDHANSPNFPLTPASSHSQLDPMLHQPRAPAFDSGLYGLEFDNSNYLLSDWLSDGNLSPTESSAPISIPPPSPAVSIGSLGSADSSSFVSYNEYPLYAKSPEHINIPQYSRSSDDFGYDNESISPYETSLHPPPWATRLWDAPLTTPSRDTSPEAPLPALDGDPYATQRQRFPVKRDPTPVSQIFMSSSAPSVSHVRSRAPSLARTYSRRAESFSESDDRDATIRRTKRVHIQEAARIIDKPAEGSPQKSLLRPPKLAPSAWQLYFTDFIQRTQAASTKKLNVAQAAKEAGQEYAKLSAEEKETYKRRSQAAKDARERELSAYMRTLTPDDIKRENAFRTAQRKAGRSRKANMKDPNAPKKPLSAYFMFLQRIRSDPDLVREVFGDEGETTKQSVLAAAKWRSMTDDERKPFLAQAEQDKLEYEAARKLYENGSIAYESSIDFGTTSFMTSTLGPSRHVKSESSESDGDEFMVDDGAAYRI